MVPVKNILVLLHDDPAQESRLKVAVDVVRALDGHLIGLDVTVPPIVIQDYYTDAGGVIAMVNANDHETRNIGRVEARLEAENVPATIKRAYGRPDQALANAADLADLIVVSSRLHVAATEHDRMHLERLPLHARCPLLAVPPECAGLDPSGSAVVAWDGSDQAARALRAATPLLALSGEVVMLEVGAKTDDNPCEEALKYLARHGIDAHRISLSWKDTVADTIASFAQRKKADYIVMGAYGQGRALEAIFGGVTRTMLKRSNSPLFIAH